MWRLLLGTKGVKSLVQGLSAAATAGFEPRTVWSEVRRHKFYILVDTYYVFRVLRPVKLCQAVPGIHLNADSTSSLTTAQGAAPGCHQSTNFRGSSWPSTHAYGQSEWLVMRLSRCYGNKKKGTHDRHHGSLEQEDWVSWKLFRQTRNGCLIFFAASAFKLARITFALYWQHFVQASVAWKWLDLGAHGPPLRRIVICDWNGSVEASWQERTFMFISRISYRPVKVEFYVWARFAIDMNDMQDLFFIPTEIDSPLSILENAHQAVMGPIFDDKNRLFKAHFR